jgi:hypothetical protein
LANETAAAAKAFSFWNYVPNFDGQTLFTFVVGTIVTLLTFWVGYKKTIGAQEERTRAVNQELVSSVLRRVAVEREVMEAVQFQYIKTAKSYKSNVSSQRLIGFDDALSIVLSEIIDNDFLDPASKKSIIELIEKSRATQKAVSDIQSQRGQNGRLQLEKLQRWQQFATVSLAFISMFVGLVAAFVSARFLDEKGGGLTVTWDDSNADKLKLVFVLFAMVMTMTAGILSVWIVWVRRRRSEAFGFRLLSIDKAAEASGDETK